MTRQPHFSTAEMQAARYCAAQIHHTDLDPCLAPLVNQPIGRIAYKWTMRVTEVLMDQTEPHVTRLVEMVEGVSHKMRTRTLRQMERNGLLIRTVHPVVLPHVDHRLTHMRLPLSAAFCGVQVWLWATDHLNQIEATRRGFDRRAEVAAARLQS